ncbi:hypothetical protein DRJ48_04575 [Candidatus Woesearchaeota archaeon]|nr:MAG: hypothetical protein DRJ48_04575 [Candidatus Woesearchaeota archaeon]
MVHLHHLIKEEHTAMVCPYCSRPLKREFKEEFFSDAHYHLIVCECGKEIRLRQNHHSTGNLDDILA